MAHANRRAAFFFLAALGATLAAGCLQSDGNGSGSGPLVGAVAQEITGADFDGNSLRLSDFRGKVILLDFWKPACPPCRQMHLEARRLVEKYGPDQLIVLGVFDGTSDVGRRLHHAERLTWPSIVDSHRRAARDWKISGTPTIFLIDPDGVIRYQSVGVPQSMKELEQQIERLIEA
jgi:peroxiredoxin